MKGTCKTHGHSRIDCTRSFRAAQKQKRAAGSHFGGSAIVMHKHCLGVTSLDAAMPMERFYTRSKANLGVCIRLFLDVAV